MAFKAQFQTGNSPFCNHFKAGALRSQKMLSNFVTYSVLLFAMLFGPQAAFSDTHVSGTVSVDTTWTKAGSPYIVDSAITVRGTDGTDGVTTLTVEPGVEIRFYQTYLYVSGHPDPGALVARGTEAEPIVFTSSQSTKAPGDWCGIQFEDFTHDATTVMEHCIVEYAGYNGAPSIKIRYASPVIKDSIIRSGANYDIEIPYGYGFSFSGSITGTTFYNGLNIAGTNTTGITGNIFHYNNLFPILVKANDVGTVVNGSSFNGLDGGSYIEVADGIVTKDATWPSVMPYRFVNTDMRIQGRDGSDGVTTLTLEPGVEIRFYRSYLYVSGHPDPGALVARGTEAEPIVFTSSQSTKAPGDWYGIQFEDFTHDATTVMEHCTVEYAGYNGAPSIKIRYASPVIKDSIISSGANYDIEIPYGYGFSFSGSITGTTFYNGLNIAGTNTTGITGNIFHYNNSFPIKVKANDVGTVVNGSSFDGLDGESYIEVTDEVLSKDATWPAIMPYLISTSLRLYIAGTDGPDGVTTLTIEPGAELRFALNTNRYNGMDIGNGSGAPGALVAQGTESQPIKFTSHSSTPVPGDWGGIWFYNTSNDATCLMEHCIVEYAGSNLFGNVCTYDSNPAIKNSTIRNSKTSGIFIRNAYPNITGNTFTGNVQYDVNVESGGGGFSANVFDNLVRVFPDSVGQLSSNNTFNNTDSGKVIEVYGGTVTKDATWSPASPIKILSNITVQGTDGPDGITTLTLEPGVELRFVINSNRDNRIDIGYYSTSPGALVAKGTEGEPIIFTSDTGTPAPGDWQGIHFWDASNDAACILEYCIIEYAGSNLYGNVCTDVSNPTIKDSIIRNSKTSGVFIRNAHPNIAGNTFTGNVQYDVNVDSGGGTVTGNTFNGRLYMSGGELSSFNSNIINWGNNSQSRLNPNNVGEFSSNNTFNNLSDTSFIEVSGGALNRDSVWSGKLGYIILSPITVQGTDGPDGITTLTLEPGVELRFVINSNRDNRIEVGYYGGAPGALVANGTESEPIKFTSNTTTPTPGDWSGIWFLNTASDATCLLEYCIIEYAGSNLYGNVCTDVSNPTIKDSIIRNSKTSGIFIRNAYPNIAGNTFTGNVQYDVNVESGGGSFDGNVFSTPVRVPADSMGMSGKNTFNFSGSGKVIEVIGGTVTKDAAWSSASPIKLLGNVTVQGTDGADGVTTLTILPGTSLYFDPRNSLSIGGWSGASGALIAQGTTANPIKFSSSKTTPAPGDWVGILFYNTSSDSLSIMEHCAIEYAGYDYYNSNISLIDASPTFQYNNIRYSSNRGIYISNSGSNNAVIACNNIEDNPYGIYLSSTNPFINGNNFRRNASYAIYNSTSGTPVVAKDNWWNDENGPNHNGEATFGTIDFTPWLIDESQCVDDASTNLKPFPPSNPSPENNAVNVVMTGGEVLVTWIGTDPNAWDSLSYDIYFGTAAGSLTQVAHDVADEEFQFTALSVGATYFWQVTAKDGGGKSATGPVWQFTTTGESPDLTITELVPVPATDVLAGQQVSFTATVKNIGAGPVVGAFQVAFLLDGTEIGRVPVTQLLAAGETTPVLFNWTAVTGNHTIQAVADSTDVIVEPDETNNRMSLVLARVTDPTAPTIVSTAPVNGSVLKTVSAVTITLKDDFSAVDDAAVMAGFTVLDHHSQPVIGTVSENNDVFTFTPAVSPLPTGMYTVAFLAADTEGNSANHGFTFTVDDVAPAPPLITGGSVSSGTIQARPGANFSNTPTVTLSGTREANTRLWINGTVKVVFGTGNWSIPLTLTQGANSLELWLEDPVGNRSASLWVDILVDSVGPSIVSITPPDGTFMITPPANVVVEFLEATSQVDPGNSILSIKNRVLSEVPGSWALSGNTLIFTPTAAFPESIYQVEIQLKDTVGNQSPAVRSIFTVDSTLASAPVVNPVTSPTHASFQVISGTKEAYAGIIVNGVKVVANTPETTWQHTVSLTAGENRFVVKAMDAAGNESGTVTVDIFFDDDAPGPVTTLVLDPNGDGKTVKLSWTGYNESASGDIAGYRVYVQTAEFTTVTGFTEVATVIAGTFQTEIKTLSRHTTYWFAVAAVDQGGKMTDAVTSISAAPVDIIAPENVSHITAQCFDDRLILNWTHSVNTGGDLSGYKIYFEEETEGAPVPADQRSFEKTGLTAATGYQFKVTAVDTDGNESTGVPFTGVTLLANPENLTVTPFSGYVNLSFSPVTPAEYVKQYRIYASVGPFASVTGMTPKLTTTQTTAAISGLTNNIPYYFAVTTENISGGEQQEVTTVTATPTVDTQGPQLTSVTFNGGPLTDGQNVSKSGFVEVSATDPSGVSRIDFTFDGALIRQDYSSPYSGYLDIAKKPDGGYPLVISAFDTLGNSRQASYTLVVGLGAPLAPAITSPANNAVTNRKILSVSGTSEKNTDVVLYLNGAVTDRSQTVGPLGTFKIDLPVNEGENRISAKASNRAGGSPMSEQILVTVDTSIPDSPTSLTATPKEAGAVKLSWQRPRNTTFAGYNLYRSPGSFTTKAQAQKINTTLISTAAYNDLPSSEGAWYYRVTAQDEAGNESGLSDEAAVTSDKTMPAAVSIAYSPHGKFDAATGRIAPGMVDVTLTVSEPLSAVPFLTLTPTGGIPMPVELTKITDT
ncbi:MAG: right-handed parallel beta-helix repeat-containing protein, partial [Pseudomonadota bacterium]